MKVFFISIIAITVCSKSILGWGQGPPNTSQNLRPSHRVPRAPRKCLNGFYGPPDCKNECGSCKSHPCSATNGYCSQNECATTFFLPPLCKTEIEAPKIFPFNDTSVRAILNVDLAEDTKPDVHLIVQKNTGQNSSLNTMKLTGTGSQLTYEVALDNFKPGTTYEVQALVKITQPPPATITHSQKHYFQTTGGVIVRIPEIVDLRTTHVNDTQVTLEWRTVPEKVEHPLYRIAITLDGLLACANKENSSPKGTKIFRTAIDKAITIEDLIPYSMYTAYVTASDNSEDREAGNEINFRTSATAKPTSAVENFRVNPQGTQVDWDEPDCRRVTGPIGGTVLRFYCNEPIATVTTASTSFALSRLTSELPPNTLCRVSAYVARDANGSIVSENFKEITFQTPGAAVSESFPVNNLHVLEANADTNRITIGWSPPDLTTSKLDYYAIRVLKGNETVINRTAIRNGIHSNSKEFTFQPPPNLKEEDNLTIQIYTIVEGSPELKGLAVLPFSPIVFFPKPSKPLNLTAESPERGTVTLRWRHPSISYSKLVGFEIRAEMRETKLLKYRKKELHIVCKNFTIKEDRKNYNRDLRLQPSSLYRIFVAATNSNGLNGSEAQVDVLVSGSCAFQDEELILMKNGTSLEVKVPRVLDPTEQTNVSIRVKGYKECATTGQSLRKFGPEEWVVREYPLEAGKSQTHTIEPSNGAGENCSLVRGENYIVKVQLRNGSTIFAEIVSSSKNDEQQKDDPVWLIILVIVVIIVCVILAYVFYRKRKRIELAATYSDVLDRTYNVVTYETLQNSIDRVNPTPPISVYSEIYPDNSSNVLYAVPFVPEPTSISTKYFEEYCKESAFNGVLYSQYETLPRGLIKPCDYGRLPENMPKNRDEDVIPYDDTRVILDKIPGVPYSDYINANYIRGYGEENTYIATQGPKPNTVNDFWRMIWQKEVRVICMLTNLTEDGKEMCEQYWPEVGYEYEYGEIKVSNKHHSVFADYTFRNFVLNYKKEIREVHHLHYTGWPDRGVPMYSQSLVSYLKKLVEILDGRWPVVIHCSSGDGRTGTIILCDMCVRQAIIERQINVSSTIQKICNSRANMMRTPRQYLLAHIVILESIVSVTTQIPCTETLPTRIKILREQLPSHIKRLEETTWQERALESFANKKSSEFESGIYHMIENDCYGSLNDVDNYMNAVNVDGVRIKNQYLASRLPSASDLPNFWRYVVENDIELMIVLQKPGQDETIFCDFLPGKSILVPLPDIQIETKSIQNEIELFTIENLSLTDNTKETTRSQSITVLTSNIWESDEDVKPTDVSGLVWLWQTAEKIPRKEGKALVLCRDGIKCCGLYLALCFLLERMAVEKECDVISAVRTVRRSKSEFVQDPEQFNYLYDAAVNYVECFETYANFT